MHDTNGLPVFAPDFRMTGDKLAFSGGGDLRNTLLDFRDSGMNALVFTQVYSELGFAHGSEKLYTAGFVLDEKDPRMFIDNDWTVSIFSGEIRKVERGGPFATVFIICQNGDKPVEGVTLSVGSVVQKTDKDGWAKLELSGIRERVLPLKVIGRGPAQQMKTLYFGVPVVSTSAGVVFYKQLMIDIP